MNFNMYLYSKLVEVHRQDLQHETDRRRMLKSLPHVSMRRWLAGRLGVLFVAVGTRLENYEHAGKVITYDLAK